MATFVNPYLAAATRASARVAMPRDIPPMPKETAPVAAPTAVMLRRSPMKLLEGAFAADGGRDGIVPAAVEARVRTALAAAPTSAVLAIAFASLIDDPSAQPDRFPTAEAQRAERARLLAFVDRLSRPGARHDATLLQAVRTELRQSLLRPRPDDVTDADALFAVAQQFAEQDELGGEEAIEALYLERRREFDRTGRWRGTLLELRACFWFGWLWEERQRTPADAAAAAALACFRQIRRQWDEHADDLERALELFRGPRASGPVRMSAA